MVDLVIHRPSPSRGQTGLLASLLFSIALVACGAPVKVERVNLHTAYEDLNRTALSSNQLSETTRTVLRRRRTRHRASAEQCTRRRRSDLSPANATKVCATAATGVPE